MPSLVLAFCGLLLLGSTAAFLLYVSLLTIVAVVLILAAAMFMFVFGVHVERRRRVSEIPSEEALPQMQGTHTLLGARDGSAHRMEAGVRASRPFTTVPSHMTGSGQKL
jgi:cytochrome c biogenesis protein CcdA